VLVIPKKHFAGLKEAQADDADVIGRCLLAAAEIARQRNIEQGYRTVINVGPGAGSQCFIFTSTSWETGDEVACWIVAVVSFGL